MDLVSGKIISVFPKYRLLKVKVTKTGKKNISTYKEEEFFETNIVSLKRNFLGDFLIGRYICIRVKERDSFGKLTGTYQCYRTDIKYKNKKQI